MTNPDTNGAQRRPAWLAAIRRLLARILGQSDVAGSRPSPSRFADRHQPGIFTVESSRAADAIADQAADDGLTVARLNAAGVTTKAAFLDAAARDLQFPDYFGHNWDAFADCLGDFAAASPSGTILILDHFDDFARAALGDWRVALTILQRATKERPGTDRPLYVLLNGRRDAAPDAPAIDATHL